MRFLVTAAAVAALALPAAAEWKKMDGQRVPSIEIEDWLNAGRRGPSGDDLRGKVILLEFFGTG